MRIVVHGQQAFGQAVLEALLDRGEDVVAVYVAPDRDGRPADPMAEATRAHGLPLLQPASFRDPAVAAAFADLRPDLQVMAFVTLFVPSSFLGVPTHGSIQYHPSLLPRHRGPSAINWPIIGGESETGLTVFWPDDGLDTGDVLLQRTTRIGPDDTLGSVYFDRLFPMGVEAMVEAVDLVRDGKAPRTPQDEAAATYAGWCSTEHAQVDWSRPTRQVHDLIRGCDPSPAAWSQVAGTRLQVFGSRAEPARNAAGIGGSPGTIIAIDDGLVVAVADGRVRISRVRPAGGAKVDAATWASESGVTVGDRLG